MPKSLIVMCTCGIFVTITLLWGTLLYLKTKTLNVIHLHSFLQLLQKVQVLGDFFILYYCRNLQHLGHNAYNLAQILI